MFTICIYIYIYTQINAILIFKLDNEYMFCTEEVIDILGYAVDSLNPISDVNNTVNKVNDILLLKYITYIYIINILIFIVLIIIMYTSGKQYV